MKDIFWIKGNPPALLAIVLRPLGDAYLEGELLRLKRSGIQNLVSLLEHWEAGSLGLANEGPAAVHVGLNFYSYSFPHIHVPVDTDSFRNFVAGLADRLRAGRIGWRSLPGQHRQVRSRCGLHAHSSGLAARGGAGGH
jgi:hypothetical protein